MQQKEDTIQEHYKRINNVLSYIECNLYKQFNLDELADISNFGKRHFQRIMKAHLNEPIGAYITKRRLETAAKLIMYSKEQISDIAYKMGYLEIASFSNSFKKQIKAENSGTITPSQPQTSIGWDNGQKILLLEFQNQRILRFCYAK